MIAKWCAATAIFLIGQAVMAADKDPKPVSKQEVVKVILDVKFAYNEKDEPHLSITARGAVPTGGWTDVQLSPRKRDKPPADGIYEFVLTATPPDGPATQAITEVKATYRWEMPPKDLKGLKISGFGEGVKTVRFDDKKK